MKSTQPFLSGTGASLVSNRIQRQQAVEIIRLRGTPKKPLPPRDIFFQGGANGGLLTWKLPAKHDDIKGWRIYKDTESSLYQAVSDKGQRQLYVASSSGATPPVTNFFVCSVNAMGIESPTVQIQAKAATQTGSPVVPSPPPGYTKEGAGGANRNQYVFHNPKFNTNDE